MLVRSQGAYKAGRRPFEVSGPSAKINARLPQRKRSSELTAYVEIPYVLESNPH